MRLFSLFCLVFLPRSAANGSEFRLGIIGTDTSHTKLFTRILNDDHDPEHVPGARVVVAYKGGSPDILSSRARVDGFATELVNTYHIEMVPDVPDLCSKVDGVLLLSSDGRAHLSLVKSVIAAKKPVFIDLPIASTLEDAREIAQLAKEAGVPWFAASAARFSPLATFKYTDTSGVDIFGPGPLEEHHYLDLSWYAVHPIELLFTLMGPGCCREVARVTGGNSTSGSDVIVGLWKDGRIGAVRTLRPHGPYGGAVMRPRLAVSIPPTTNLSYAPLVRQIVAFFETGVPPVANEETLQICSFMDAAQRSKEAGGQPMPLR
jgi:hypothetical protein